MEAERFLSQGFKIGDEDLVELEGLESGVVEADNRTDGSSRFVNLGLSVQLRPFKVEDSHLGEEVGSDQDSVELVE